MVRIAAHHWQAVLRHTAAAPRRPPWHSRREPVEPAPSPDGDGQRFLDLSIHKSGEQYRSFMYMQARAQQLFSASAIIMAVLASVLVNAKVSLGRA